MEKVCKSNLLLCSFGCEWHALVAAWLDTELISEYCLLWKQKRIQFPYQTSAGFVSIFLYLEVPARTPLVRITRIFWSRFDGGIFCSEKQLEGATFFECERRKRQLILLPACVTEFGNDCFVSFFFRLSLSQFLGFGFFRAVRGGRQN